MCVRKAFGGAACVGDTSQRRDCNTNPCSSKLLTSISRSIHNSLVIDRKRCGAPVIKGEDACNFK